VQSQFYRGIDTQLTPHQYNWAGVPSLPQNPAEGFEDGVCIDKHAGETGSAVATSITTEVGHEQADIRLFIQRSEAIIIAGDLAIAVEEKDAGRQPAFCKHFANELLSTAEYGTGLADTTRPHPEQSRTRQNQATHFGTNAPQL